MALSGFIGHLPILESIKDKRYSEGGFTETSKSQTGGARREHGRLVCCRYRGRGPGAPGTPADGDQGSAALLPGSLPPHGT